MTATVTCPNCGRQLSAAWIDNKHRGLLPWHTAANSRRICPGSETYTPLPPTGQETLL